MKCNKCGTEPKEEKNIIQIKRWDNEKVIYECEADNIKEAVEKAVKEGVSLAYAYLYNAGLSKADLRYANLRYANLYRAYLYKANLHNANLSYADLSYADLSKANLRDANLCYCKMDKKVFDQITKEWFEWDVIEEAKEHD